MELEFRHFKALSKKVQAITATPVEMAAVQSLMNKVKAEVKKIASNPDTVSSIVSFHCRAQIELHFFLKASQFLTYYIKDALPALVFRHKIYKL